MPLYDMLNEFQKVSSHMAAVVKAKRKVQNPISLCGEEKIEETKMVGGSVSTLTTPLLQEEKPESCIVDIKKGTKQHIDGDKQTSLLQNDSANKHVADVVEEIDDGEVIGIITLEDVFEELLQEEIVDENDEYVNVHKRIRVAAAAAASSVARAPSVRRFNWSKDTATIHLLFHSCWGGSESTSHNFKFCENPTKHSRVFD